MTTCETDFTNEIEDYNSDDLEPDFYPVKNDPKHIDFKMNFKK